MYYYVNLLLHNNKVFLIDSSSKLWFILNIDNKNKGLKQ